MGHVSVMYTYQVDDLEESEGDSDVHYTGIIFNRSGTGVPTANPHEIKNYQLIRAKTWIFTL